MPHRLALMIALVIGALTFAPSSASAGIYVPDQSFGTNGELARPFDASSGYSYAIDLEQDANGRLIALSGGTGTAGQGVQQIVLDAILPSGEVDTSFGTNGRTTFDVPLSSTFVRQVADVAIDVEDRILVLFFDDAAARWGIVRFRVDGSLDTTWTPSGVAVYTMPAGKRFFATTMLLSDDGDMSVLGSVVPASGYAPMTETVAKIDAGTAALESTYGVNGYTQFAEGVIRDGVVVGDDIVFASITPGGGDARAVRIDPSGGLVGAFGAAGRASVPVATDVTGMNSDSEGRIYIAGPTSGTYGQGVIVRLSEAGVIDPAFGSGANQVLEGVPVDLQFNGSGRLFAAVNPGVDNMNVRSFGPSGEFQDFGGVSGTKQSVAVEISDGAPVLLGTAVSGSNGAGVAAVIARFVPYDSAAPSIAITSPVQGAQFARGAHVALEYSCVDEIGGSGVASCAAAIPSGSNLDTSVIGTQVITVVATDNNGNSASLSRTIEIVEDSSPPNAVVTSPSDGAIYDIGQPVVADFQCVDELIGSGIASCDGDVADGQIVDTSESGPHQFAVTAVDNAGNTATTTVTYTVVAPDQTAPSISITSPAVDAEFQVGQSVEADFACSDTGGSGLLSCVGSVSDGSSLDTSASGSYVFTVVATDVAGNSSSLTRTYSVVAPTSEPINVIPTTWVPPVPSANDNGSVELGVKFRSDVAGSLLGVRFYKGAGNSGSHIGNVWSASGTNLATAQFTNETSTGWQEVRFATPVQVQPGVTYVASYFAPNGGYAFESGGFASQLSNPPLHFPSSSSVGGNGVFNYASSSSFPASTYNAANYGVDIVFEPAAPAEPVTLPPGSQTIFDDDVTPTLVVADDRDAVELGVRFASDVDGLVHGVRFWQGSYANSGPHTGSLWNSAGTRLATAAFTSTTGSGWQTVLFSSPVSIDAGDVYTASYFAPAGGYAATLGGFDESITRGHLYAPSDVNGVYRYGGGFPSSTYSNANYFVDVVFEPTQAPAVFAPDTTERVDDVVSGVFAAGRTIVEGDDSGSAQSTEVGVRFSSERDGYVRGVRFWKSDLNTGPHTGSLWRADGSRIATATFTNETSTGWQQVEFTAPVHVRAGATYVASYFAPNGHFARVAGGLAGGAMNAQLRALSSSEGGNGVFVAASTGGFPSQDSGGDDFGVDVLFSLPVEGGSLIDHTGAPLEPSANDNGAVELGTKFRVARNARATEIRFFRGIGNVGTHVGSLWSNSGVLLGRVTFENQASIGWQHAELDVPVELAAGQTYVVSYHAPNGHYAVTTQGLSTPLGGPLVVAPASDIAGGNGVFSYSAMPTFPTGSWQNANYWVDVVVASDAPISTGGTAPSAPTDVRDGDGADLEMLTSQSTMTANWTPAVDFDGDIERHEYCISRSADCSSGIVRRWTQSASPGSMTAAGMSLGLDRFYVCVRARDTAGNTSSIGCSDGVSTDATPPSTPTITAPGSGSSVPAGNVLASWIASADPETDIDRYEYRVADTGSIESASWISTQSLSVMVQLGAGSWKIEVRSVNAAGTRSAIASRTFTAVGVQGPIEPTMVRDGLGASDVDWIAPQADMHATWVPTSNLSVAAQQWCLTAYETCNVNALVSWTEVAPTTTSATVPFNANIMLAGVALRFCVRTVLANDAGFSSQRCSDSQAHRLLPPAPHRVWDGAGEADVDVVALTTTEYRGAWSNVVGLVPIASYEWRLCESGDCGTPVANGSSATTRIELLDLALAPSGNYELCVTAIDSDGMRSAERCSDGVVVEASQPEVTNIADGPGSVDRRAIAAGSTIEATWSHGPTLLSTVTAAWQVCEDIACNEDGATAIASGSDSTGHVEAGLTNAQVGTTYYVCVTTRGDESLVCSDGAVGADSDGDPEMPVLSVRDTRDQVSFDLEDYDTILAVNGYNASWDADAAAGAYFWRVCTDAECNAVLDDGLIEDGATSVNVDNEQLVAGTSYYTCIVGIDTENGSATSAESCSDGAELQLPENWVVEEDGRTHIFGNTTWTEAGGPYIIDTPIIVGDDRYGAFGAAVTLTIQAGTIIQFVDSGSITVARGSVLAVNGTTDNPVRIQGASEEELQGCPGFNQLVLKSSGNTLRGLDITGECIGGPSVTDPDVMTYFGDDAALVVMGDDNSIHDSTFRHLPIADGIIIDGDRTLVEGTQVHHIGSANYGAQSGIRVTPDGSMRLVDSTVEEISGGGVEIQVRTQSSPSIQSSIEGSRIRNNAWPAGCGEYYYAAFCKNLYVEYDHLDSGDVKLENGPLVSGNDFAASPEDQAGVYFGLGYEDSKEVSSANVRLRYPAWPNNHWGRNPVPRYCVLAHPYPNTVTPGYSFEILKFTGPPQLSTPDFDESWSGMDTLMQGSFALNGINSIPLGQLAPWWGDGRCRRDWPEHPYSGTSMSQDVVSVNPVTPSTFPQADWREWPFIELPDLEDIEGDPLLEEAFSDPKFLCSHGVDLACISEKLGDPVDSFTGDFVHERTDISMPGSNEPFAMQRTYHSRNTETGVLGQGWSTQLDYRVRVNGDRAVVQVPDGPRLEYARATNGVWIAPPGVWSELNDAPTGYELKQANGTVIKFDAEGQYRGKRDQYGNGFDIVDVPAASGKRLLVGTDGRIAKLSFDEHLLTSIVLDDGRTVSYSYTQSGPPQVESVTLPGDRTWHYVYDFEARLACETDPDGRLVFENQYLDTGRVLRQWDGSRGACSLPNSGGVVGSATPTLYRSSWNEAHTRVTTVLTDPEGAQWTHVYDPSGRILARQEPSGRCTSFSFDSRDNQVMEVRPNGLEISSTYDSDGRVLSKRYQRADEDTIWHCPGARPAPQVGAFDEPYTDRWEYADDAGNVSRQTRTFDGESVPSEDIRYTYEDDYLVKTERIGDTSAADPGADAPTIDTEYVRDAAGRAKSVTNELDETTEYVWSDEGHLLSEQAPGRAATRYRYDNRGNLTGIYQPRAGLFAGLTLSNTFTYDDADRLTSETDAYGSRTTYSYDDAGNLKRVVDAENREWVYHYNQFAELETVNGPGGRVESYEYDRRGLQTERVVNGERTSYRYDPSGRLQHTVDARGNASSDPLAHRWTYSYDSSGKPSVVTGPDQLRIEYVHDLLGRQVLERTKHGSSTTIGTVLTQFDDAERQQSTQRQSGAAGAAADVEQTRFDRHGRDVLQIDARGNQWRRLFDDAGQVVNTISPEGRITGYEYTPDGMLAAEIGPRGFEDPANPGQSVSDPQDADAITYARYRTRYQYEDEAPIQTALISPSGRTTRYETDRAGRLRAQISAAGERTEWEFDRVGRIRAVTGPDGERTAYAYDDATRTVTMTDPRSGETQYSADPLGRTIGKRLPSGREWEYRYHPGGLLQSVTDPIGTATEENPSDGNTSFEWDVRGRQQAINYSDPGTPDVTWSHDVAPGTEIETMLDTAGFGHERRFDFTRGITRETAIAPGATRVVEYEFDAVGNPVKRDMGGPAYELGATFQWNTNADGLTTSVAHTPTAEAGYEYDLAGNVTKVTPRAISGGAMTDTGIVELREWTVDGQLDKLTLKRGSTLLAESEYERDDAGRITRVDRLDGSFREYAYDNAGRLSMECTAQPCGTSGGTWTRYAYDRSGNRISSTPSTGEPTTYRYDVDDRLTRVETDGSEPIDLTYNERGELLDSGTQRRWFDQAGRVTGTGPAGAATPTTTYVIDGEGKRIRETTSAGTAMFNWDSFTSPIPVISAEGDPTTGEWSRHYGHGPLGPQILLTAGASSSPAGSERFYHTGGDIGSIEQITSGETPSGTGRLVAEYDYTAWGETETADELAPQPLGFAGERHDDADNYHLRAREYDPSLGVFASPDPLARGIGRVHLGTQAYAEQVPTYFVDPLGLEAVCDVRESASYCANLWEQMREFGQVVGRNPYVRGGVLAGTVGTACGGFGCITDILNPDSYPMPIQPRPQAPTMGGGESVGGVTSLFPADSCYNPFSPLATLGAGNRVHDASYASRGCGANVLMAKASKQSGKKRATDGITDAKQNPPKPGESLDDYMDRLFGKNPGPTGANTPYGKTKKWAERKWGLR